MCTRVCVHPSRYIYYYNKVIVLYFISIDEIEPHPLVNDAPTVCALRMLQYIIVIRFTFIYTIRYTYIMIYTIIRRIVSL